MFAKERRASAYTPRSFRKPVRIPGKTVPAQVRVIDVHDIVAMPGLFIFEKCAGRVNRRGGQPLPLKLVKEILDAIVQGARFNETIEQRPQKQSVLHVLEFGVDQFRGISEPPNQASPVIRLIAEDARKTVFALVGFSNRCCLAVSGPLRHFASDTVAGNNA